MTNFEKYKYEILQITDTGSDVGLINGKPVGCDETSCCKCDMQKICEYRSKEYELLKWAVSEYKEHPKLTKRQHAFCEAFPNMYIKKYTGYGMHLYNDTNQESSDFESITISNKIISFPFMETGKMYNTSEMLKWEVEE